MKLDISKSMFIFVLSFYQSLYNNSKKFVCFSFVIGETGNTALTSHCFLGCPNHRAIIYREIPRYPASFDAQINCTNKMKYNDLLYAQAGRRSQPIQSTIQFICQSSSLSSHPESRIILRRIWKCSTFGNILQHHRTSIARWNISFPFLIGSLFGGYALCNSNIGTYGWTWWLFVILFFCA